MKVLISGAGVAGNALAFWLTRMGHKVTVVERFPGLRTSGLQIDLRGHGIEVIRRMGLEKELKAKLAPEQGVQMVDSAGRCWGYFPSNGETPGPDEKKKARFQNFTSEFEIMRGDLCRVLHDATSHHTKYIFGTSIEGFQDNGSSVDVNFTDGTSGRFDLLVGADGQGSSLRNMLFDPETAKAAYRPLKDMFMAYVTIPRPMKEGDEYIATAYIAPGRKGILTRRHSPDTLQVYLGCTTDSERMREAVNPTGRRRQAENDIIGDQIAAWKGAFEGAGWQTDEIFRALLQSHRTSGSDFYTERPALVKLTSWSKGRVTLIGDAAWCPTATTGMGTTSAIVGAYVFAGEIQKHCGGDGTATSDDLDNALAAYQRTFGPFMDQVQRDVSTEGSDHFSIFPSTSLGIAVVLRMVWVISLLRINVGRWLLKEEIRGWDLPAYDGMTGC